MRFAFVLFAVALLATPLASSAWAQATPSGPPTIEELTAEGRIHGVEVSPSGRYLAITRHLGAGDQLQVIDLATRTQTMLAGSEGGSVVLIHSVHWKTDDRLIYGFRPIRLPTRSRGSKGEPWIYSIAGLLAVGPDGSRPQRVASNAGVIDWLDFDPRHIVIHGRDDDTLGRWGKALKVEVESGKVVQLLDAGDATTWGWETNREGNVIARYERIGMSSGLRVLGRDGQGWRELFTIREKDIRAMPELEIVGASSDPAKLYVAVRPESGSDSDTRELRLYDFASRSMGPRLMSVPKYDFSSVVVDEHSGDIAALCYWTDVHRCDYLTPVARKDYEALVALFGPNRSVFMHSASASGDVQVVFVRGPTDPGSFQVYYRATGKVEPLGNQYPALKADRLASSSRFDWKARDGFALSGYVTQPRSFTGEKPPLVLMPHGGPEARDSLDYSAWAQAYAARGYVVFQPNFRGSGGFGSKFAAMGYGQWGLRMQDDVMDGVQALIDQGKVDPDRICVVGASYGGYVSLYAGAKEPARFKCVISFAGVSDLVAIQKWERARGGGDSPAYQYWLKSLGDPDKDRVRLEATSPITYAQGYGPPVLLIHGTDDDIVPIAQSRAMEKALKRAGRNVRLIELEGEGHGGWDGDVEAGFLKEMVAFVDAAIGTPK